MRFNRPKSHETPNDHVWVEETLADPNPTIVLDLGSSLADRLRVKRGEYQRRMDDYAERMDKSPYAGVRLKAYVLDHVLANGSAEYAQLREDMLETGVLQEPLLREGLRDGINFPRYYETGQHTFSVTEDQVTGQALEKMHGAFLVIKAYAEDRANVVRWGTGLPAGTN